MKKYLFILIGLFFLDYPIITNAGTGTWTSKVTGGSIKYTTTESSSPSKDASSAYLTVVYLENLGIKKLGGNTNATDVSWLLSKGYRVIELDYANNSNAISPNINADIISINTAINSGSFCGLTNCSKYRSWVLFEGYRINRDVSYFKDDPTIYNYSTSYTVGDSLYMDIIYPANTSAQVPVVLSFSYSNSYFGNTHQRLNLGNTLAGFNDSFLEGAPANGIAWAIADHPKYCAWGNGKPVGSTVNKVYTSYEVNPDAAQKVKSAVRTLRALGTNLGMSGKIGVYGFSRGSDASSLAIGDRSMPTFENAGLNIGVSDDVQVAGLGSGVFDFTYIYNTTGDGDSNLETNCPIAWGALATNQSTWQAQGSYYLTQTTATAPVIFFYNTTDAVYYQNQIKHFKSHLDSIGVPTDVITDYGTGHGVPQTSVPLSTVYNFFVRYLTPPSVATGIQDLFYSAGNALSVLVSNCQNSNEIKISYTTKKTGKSNISLYNLSGDEIYKTTKFNYSSGTQNEIIRLNKNISKGIYIVKVENGNEQGFQKFVKE